MRIKIYVTRGTVDHDDFHENLSQRGFVVPILLQKRSPNIVFCFVFFFFFKKIRTYYVRNVRDDFYKKYRLE